jgi:shikimate dehydrogenase
MSERVGLIGWPVGHSVSPAMHNAAFERLGLDWRYELLPVPPGELDRAMGMLRAGAWRGANVTVPHKQAVLGLLDEVDATARTVGAVNTILVREGRLVGTNTDVEGAMLSLRGVGFDPAGRRALVLGAGGAARAVVHGLAGAGCQVTIHNRAAARALDLAHQMSTAGRPVAAAATLEELDLDAFDLLVNATPAGMAPRAETSPWPEGLPLPGQWTVFDLVYNPAETRLLARARVAGARLLGGLPMLVYQGALAFELWTGIKPPVDVMYAAARRALASMGMEEVLPGGEPTAEAVTTNGGVWRGSSTRRKQ